MKRILVAPLHWGLGHATRCIPLINSLLELNFEVVLASDGAALRLLMKEFPQLDTLELPSYNINYPIKGSRFKTKIIQSTPHILKTIKKEKKLILDYLKKNKLDGIISDNRFGVRHKSIPSVFITHQLKVLSGNTTWLSTKLHQKMISKFDVCWVPDNPYEPNLSGELGHLEKTDFKVQYIGPLSRFERKETGLRYDLMVVLSGPEPQRTLLETILIDQLKDSNQNILLVKGLVESQQTKVEIGSITHCNFMTSHELENALNASKLILSRSGYTTVMDLNKLGKKAFFIPTPGQFEQEYLAGQLKIQKVAPYCHQDEFNLEKLEDIKHYSGFKSSQSETDFGKLFSLF